MLDFGPVMTRTVYVLILVAALGFAFLAIPAVCEVVEKKRSLRRRERQYREDAQDELDRFRNSGGRGR